MFTVSVVRIWGLRLFTEWGSDFGSYYAHAYFIDDNFSLYNDAFSHKGPLYYLFISVLGKIIGWGAWQAYFTLVTTLLIFYMSVIYVLSKRGTDSIAFIIILVISLVLLDNQDTNSSIALFQGGFLFLSFYYLMQSIATVEDSKAKEYVVSVTLFICAALVRIDALMYAPIFMIAVIFSSINRQSYLFFLQRMIVGLSVLTILYMINKMYFGYSLSDFYLHNIEFHRFYAEGSFPNILGIIVRPVHFSLLMNTGIIIMFLTVLLFKHGSFMQECSDSKIVMIIQNHNTQRYIISLFIVLSGAAFWVISSSDKNYHVFIIAIPLLFFVVYWGVVLGGISKKLMFVSSPILLYMLVLTTGPGLMTVIKHTDCLTDVFCTESPVHSYKQTIDNMSQKRSATIIGGRGWTYLFAKTKPEKAISDWWMYYRKVPFVTKHLLDGHNKLLNQPAGYEFWIDNDMLNGDERSDYFYEILGKSALVEDEGKYSRYRIN